MSITADILLTLSLWWYFYGWPGGWPDGWVSENGNFKLSCVEAELGKSVGQIEAFEVFN